MLPKDSNNYAFNVCRTPYRCVTGKIWKDSKYCRKNKSEGVRKIFLLPTLMTFPPHQKNKQNKKNPAARKGKRRVQAPRKTSL